jgi:hypothetical protein
MLLISVTACSSYKHNPDNDPVSLGTEYKAGANITLKNGYASPTPFDTDQFMGANLDGDYQVVTENVIKRMRREFEHNKVKLTDNSNKVITVRVMNITANTGAVSTKWTVSVEFELSNGKKFAEYNTQTAYWGRPEGLMDRMIATSLGKLMTNNDFIAFVNN